MGCGTSFVKYMLFFFNLLFALVGLVMIGIGTAVLVNWTAVKEQIQGHLNVAPWLFIIIGSVVFVIAFFGCCGAIRESHCMIVTYAIFLLVIIIIQVVLAVLMFAYAQDIRNVLVKSVDKVFDTAYHTNDEASKAAFNNIQEQFNCCGKSSYTDYGAVLLPDSCCSKGFSTVGRIIGTCQVADASNVGCSDALGSFYDKWNKTIAGVAIGVACIEVIGALFALCLANSIRNMERRYA